MNFRDVVLIVAAILLIVAAASTSGCALTGEEWQSVDEYHEEILNR